MDKTAVHGRRAARLGTRPDRGQARRVPRLLLGAASASLLAGLPAALFGAAPASADTAAVTAPFVVSDGVAGDAGPAASAVGGVGGTVLGRYDISGAVDALLSSSQASALTAQGLTVAPDTSISVQDATTTGAAHSPSAVFPQETGATQLWSQGDTGQGVNVAVVDTGIDALPDFAGRLVGGVDLSGEGNAFADNYGHGTFVAGLIAGNGASSAGAYTGEAPGAGLVSVKVAGASGQTDLATVLAGIAWVVQHRDALHIGVLNLSFGMLPTVSTVANPLDQAVEQAWRAGIVVVAAAGNAGPFNGSILSPGDDPLVITAGTVDDQATASPADDTVPPFSSVGPTSADGWIKPDVVAPGRSVVSLRAPGSTVDTLFPAARIGAGNFVGSGTSFSAAVTSGAAALLLAQLHGAQPDDVKGRLLAGAAPGPVGNPFVDGHGIVSLPGALAVGPGNSVHLVQQAPTQATPVGATVPLSQSWSASAWNGANYRGSFAGLSWNGLSWNGLSWNGLSWNGLSWNGFTLGNNAWDGLSWNGVSWNGLSWNGLSWNGLSWNGLSWNGTCWASVSWNGLSWNGSSWS